MTAIVSSIDPSETSRHILSVARKGWGSLAESTLSHDPGRLWNGWLKVRFFDSLETIDRGVSHIDAARSVVVDAARHALSLDVPEAHGIPALTFTVVVLARGAWWVFNLGPNLVLHLGLHGSKIACPPHSALEHLSGSQQDAAEWRELGGVYLPTALATASNDWEEKLRAVQIEPQSGDCLLVAPHSMGGREVLIHRPVPGARADLDPVVEMLGQPYANYPRTWVAALTA
jgi:hypothetical protein